MEVDENTVRFGLETVKSLIGISKDLTKNKGSAKEVEEKVASLADGLLSLREELQDSREYALTLRERNYELEKQLLEIKTAAEAAQMYDDVSGRLYRLDDDGQRIEEPFCNYCYVKEDKLFRLLHHPNRNREHPYFCKNCSGWV